MQRQPTARRWMIRYLPRQRQPEVELARLVAILGVAMQTAGRLAAAPRVAAAPPLVGSSEDEAGAANITLVKTESNGDVIYEKWTRPKDAEGAELRTVLTKPKIVTVKVSLRTEELRNSTKRYILSAAD